MNSANPLFSNPLASIARSKRALTEEGDATSLLFNHQDCLAWWDPMAAL